MSELSRAGFDSEADPSDALLFRVDHRADTTDLAAALLGPARAADRVVLTVPGRSDSGSNETRRRRNRRFF